MLVPGVLALLEEYAGLSDPVAELRAACLAAVGSLTGPVEVIASPQGRRVAEALLRNRGLEARAPGGPLHQDQRSGPSHLDQRSGPVPDQRSGPHLDQRSGPHPDQRSGPHLDQRSGSHLDQRGEAASYLVVGNGSARRSEKAPGHLDERAQAFDAELERALRAPDPAALAGIDEALAGELWADVAGLRVLGDLLAGASEAHVDYADDPFGVQYWVMGWTCED